MFEELLDFVSEGMFDYVGVFAYSREEGTRAFKLPDQVDDDVKLERAQAIRDAADAASAALISQRIGTQVDVLVEGVEEDGQVFGRARCQAPEVDGVTYLSSGEPGRSFASRSSTRSCTRWRASSTWHLRCVRVPTSSGLPRTSSR